jgi:hypothetical protein
VEISNTVNNTTQICVAIVAGGLLIGPMCVMSIGPSLTKILLTMSVFTIFFAARVFFGIKSTNVEIFIATAT